MTELDCLRSAIESGDREKAMNGTVEAIAAKVPPERILSTMTEAMDTVGEKFQDGSCYIPEMLLASRAMSASMVLLEPILVEAGLTPEVKVVLGTVEGDLHDIGKNLVAMMWKGANFDVIDLGTDVAPDAFVQAIREHDAELVGLSALLTTTMPAMKRTIDALQEAGLGDVKVVVGGAPITTEFADHVGAAGYAPDAASAVTLAREMLARN